jgi:hypothetical protein
VIKSCENNSSGVIKPELTPKSILPHLHNKTHFKAATTFTLAYPGSFYCPSTKSAKKAIDKAGSERYKSSQRFVFNAFKNIESSLINKNSNNKNSLRIKHTTSVIEDPQIDISRIAKDVLVNCQVLRRKIK